MITKWTIHKLKKLDEIFFRNNVLFKFIYYLAGVYTLSFGNACPFCSFRGAKEAGVPKKDICA